MEKLKIRPISGVVTKEERAKAFRVYPRRVPLREFQEQFETMGFWSPREGVRIKMWRHVPTGYVLYENHPATRDKVLPIMQAEWVDGRV